VAAEAAVTLSNLRGRLFERMRKHLEQWSVQPVAAAVFGSAARGDGTPDSDIDVLIVRPAKVDPGDPRWDGAVDDLSRAIARWSGNHASIIQATPTQIAEMVKRGEPIVADLQEDAVPLTETPVLAPPRRARR
jgi:thioesterase domain-containing protein